MARIFAFILFLMILSCSSNKKEENFNRAKTESEVREMLTEYHNAVEMGGLSAEFSYLDQSDNFFWIPPGYYAPLDFDSVKTILHKNALSFEEIKFDWQDLTIYPLSDSIATYNGVVLASFVDTSEISSSMSILESGTLIKRVDGWKLLSGQSRNLTK